MPNKQHYTLQLENLRELIKYLKFFNAEMSQIINNYQNKLLSLENGGVPVEVIAKFHKDFFAESKNIINKNEAIVNDEAIPFVYNNIKLLEQLENPKSNGLNRVLAGAAVPFVVAAPGVSSSAEVMTEHNAANEVPAIYTQSPYPVITPEQRAEQTAEQQGFRLKAAGEVAKTIQEVGEAWVEGEGFRRREEGEG